MKKVTQGEMGEGRLGPVSQSLAALAQTFRAIRCRLSGLAFWKCGGRRIYAVRVINNMRAPLKRSAKSKATSTSCYDINYFLMIVMRTLLLRGPEVLIMEIFKW